MKIFRISISSLIAFLSIFFPDYSKVLCLCAMVISGYDIFFEALTNLFRGAILDEKLLMSIAAIGAFIIGEQFEGIAVIVFFQIGESFQERAVSKSKKAILDAMDLRQAFVNIGEEKVLPNTVEVGSIITVKPGERIPIDGIVVDGEAYIDASMLNGESIPIFATVDTEVLSGSISSGLIKIRTTKLYEESTASRIMELIEDATLSKAKSENFVASFARIYTPIVVGLAVLLALVPPIFSLYGDFDLWIYRALSFLVVSCPCALVLSIPLSFFAGIGRCSKENILVKGSNHLEGLATVDTFVFDKTGTLTKGSFSVNKIYSTIQHQDFLNILSSIERLSNHPIAHAVSLLSATNLEVESFEEISGYGVKGVINNKVILCGNAKIMEMNNVDYIKSDVIGTTLYLSQAGKFIGYVVVGDTLKSNSKETISWLRNNNKKCLMLTGDNCEIASDIAKQIDIDFVANLLPQEKLDIVKKQKGKIACVGDGINDAPILALCDVGISMGGLGSDAAIEASDIVIMNDDISLVTKGIKISRRTINIVKENIFFSIGVKVLVLALIIFGITDMWLAVVADVGVSLLAVLNAIRLLYVRL